jgi:ribose transport system permease protein
MPEMTTSGPVVGTEVDLVVPRAGIARRARLLQRYGIFFVLAAVFLVGVFGVHNFATPRNISNILTSMSFVGIVAIGMTFIVISGNFVDLSVPAQVAVGALLVLGLQPHGLGVAILAAIVVVMVIGFVNGTLVGVFGANAVIVTLGVETAATGVILILNGGAYVYGVSDAFHRFGTSSIIGIPIEVVFFFAFALLAQGLLSRTRFGFSVRAIGSNRLVARASGIPVASYVLGTFVLSAFLAGTAGILLGALTNSVSSGLGGGYEFDALTAVVVGGTSLFGGVGSIWRTLAGVLLIGMVNNLMILVGLQFQTQLLVKGVIIIAAVLLDALAQRGADR